MMKRILSVFAAVLFLASVAMAAGPKGEVCIARH